MNLYLPVNISYFFQRHNLKHLWSSALLFLAFTSHNLQAGAPTNYVQYSESACLLIADQISRFKQHQHLPSYQDAVKSYGRHCQQPVPAQPREYFAAPSQAAVTQPAVTNQVTAPAVASPVLLPKAEPSLLSSMLQQLQPLLWLVPALFVFFLFRILFQTPLGMSRSEYLGFIAERQLARLLRNRLSDDYRHYHNLILKTAQGDLTEIDHLLVSPYGIFVIEVKNYQGWIFGGEHHTHWLVQHYRRKNQFQNPLRQNYKHTEAVAYLLELDDTTKMDQIFSIIAFSDRAQFKTAMPDNVMHIHEVHRHIEKISAFGRRIGDEALLRCTARLNLLADEAEVLRKQHKLQQQGQALLREFNQKNE